MRRLALALRAANPADRACCRFGVAALSAGLIASFVAVGLFVAAAGFAAGLDGALFHFVGAVALGGWASCC